ncbi:MAG TPA: low temperature requirement protein A [Sporichthyaceae bacterium]|jgi:low temperature requirement protein LtrA
MTTTSPRLHMERVAEGAVSTPLELFFDLVFVFALTQVTDYMAHHPNPEGVIRGLLVLGLLWWSWGSYAWLGNVIKADEGLGRFAVLVAMAAMFVIALAIPEAFDDSPGGWSSPCTLAVGYFVLRLMHLAAFWALSAGDAGLRSQLVRFTVALVPATTLLFVAAAVGGDTRTWLWAAALLLDLGGTWVGGASGWRIRSATHFAERHGLIIIIALGESVVAIGVGVSDKPLSGQIVAASLLGLAVSAALWFVYFDTSSTLAERALSHAPEETRARLARDAYSYLHLPMVCGVALVALGLKKVLEHAAGGEGHQLSDPLSTVGVTALVLGVGAYLMGHVAFLCRCGYPIKKHRLATAIALLPMLAIGRHVSSLTTLGIVAAALNLMVAWEVWRYAERRRALRHAGHDHA